RLPVLGDPWPDLGLQELPDRGELGALVVGQQGLVGVEVDEQPVVGHRRFLPSRGPPPTRRRWSYPAGRPVRGYSRATAPVPSGCCSNSVMCSTRNSA